MKGRHGIKKLYKGAKRGYESGRRICQKFVLREQEWI